ncbi:MAG: caspase family protein [Gammaproteobacteria bacterium]|nr:caspase family protein [Gammaproteobacteria bacterium]
MRKALIVGINYYKHGNALYGCVDDAHAEKAVLEHHDGGSDNFDCLLLTGTGSSDSVNRSDLKDSISDLFKTNSEIALFYFSGYGHIDQFLGTWDQRPVFKTNVREFVSIRKVQPPISTTELRQLVERNRI